MVMQWRSVTHVQREAVASLREAGLSTRAIGSALGTSHMQVQRDLAATGTKVPVENVASLDGRQRPAVQPPRPAPPPPSLRAFLDLADDRPDAP